MAGNLTQIEGIKESESRPVSDTLNRVLGQNRMTQVRREIGIIADRSYRERLIDEEAYKGYRELAEGRESHRMSVEMLENTRKFAVEHESKAVRVHRKIALAKSAKVASQVDEEFLMQKLVVENINFAKKSDEVETLIDQKLERMKKDKDAFMTFARHPLVKNVGYLKVDAGTKLEIPSEEDFLKMKVPERRELLEKLADALPKAEKYAKEAENAESLELTTEYGKKIGAALEKRIIGQKTAQKFMDGFKKIDGEEKKYWLAEFENQMGRYEELWAKIRSTLEGHALQEMEGNLDHFGYSELLAQFGKLKGAESARLSASYTAALERYQEKGVVGRHTVGQFVVWMQQQKLKDQYAAEAKLPEQMARYEKLWDEISKLDDDRQEFFRSKIDLWGYTEFRNELNNLSDKKTKTQEPSVLNQIRSSEVREAIVETEEMLANEGASKKKSFGAVLKKMFSHVNAERFDATSFEAQIRERALVHNPELSRDTKGRGADDTVDVEQIEEDADLLEDAGKARVVKADGFIQVESEGKNGETFRDAQVLINDERSMGRFMSEDGRNSYRSEEAGGNDDLSLAIHTEDNRTVELDLKEVRVLEKYLKEKEKEDLDEAA